VCAQAKIVDLTNKSCNGYCAMCGLHAAWLTPSASLTGSGRDDAASLTSSGREQGSGEQQREGGRVMLSVKE